MTVAALGVALALGAVAPAQAASPVLTPRVVNGTELTAGTYGYVVSLLDAARYAKDGAFQAQFCGGALTTPTTVVTAAHCVVDQKSGRVSTPGEVVVGVGSDLSSADLRVFTASTITVHPGYDIDTASNDLAVLTLSEPAAGAPIITPLRPTDLASYTAPGAPAVVAGWGNRSKTGNNFPNHLHWGPIAIFPDSTCGSGASYTYKGVTFYGYDADSANTSEMLCGAGVTNAGQIIDACQGDSGGPLIGGEGAATRLLGVVSWGDDCASQHPGVYTRMSAMTDFLVSRNAIATLAPTLAPAVAAEPLNGAVRVTITPVNDGSVIETYAATATDQVTGAVQVCYAKPRRDGLAPFCTINGLTNTIPVTVSAIAANALGNSPASPTLSITPLAVPTAGAIRTATSRAGGAAVFTVGSSKGNGSAVLSQRIACLPVAGGPGRSAAISGGRATVTKLKPIRYACRVVARNAVGAGTSNPRALTGHR